MSKIKKRNLTAVLSIALALCLLIGFTLAYLFWKTDEVDNVFTFAENIKAELDEPNWNEEEAQNLTPGKEIDKDPQITNTSENGVTEYAAIKVKFVNGAGDDISDADMVKLLNLIEIDWSTKWTLEDGTLTTDNDGKVTAATAEQIYVYDSELPQGITTEPVFYSIKIKDSVTPDELKWLAGDYGHIDGCYTVGAHDDESDVCTVTYWHHEKCAIAGESDASETEKDGTTAGGKTCNCEAKPRHDAKCPLLIKTLTGDCEHDEVQSGLGNFTIKVQGAVVQADIFDDFDDAIDALVSLFEEQTVTP